VATLAAERSCYPSPSLRSRTSGRPGARLQLLHMQELFASGHVIEHLRYAFLIYAPQSHVDIAYREPSLYTCFDKEHRHGEL
jgi:hypothetical protein